MRIAVRTLGFAFVLWVSFPTDALAVLGWLEKLSGPGPFTGGQLSFPVVCYGERVDPAADMAQREPRTGPADPKFFIDWDCHRADPDRFRVTFGADVGWFRTGQNPLTYESLPPGEQPGVRALLLVPYMAVPVGSSFEVGTGAGLIRFWDRNGDVDFSTAKWVVQPIRLTYKPLAAFGESRRWDALQFALNATFFYDIEDEHFGAQSDLLNGPELVWQPHLRLDLVKLFCGGRRTR